MKVNQHMTRSFSVPVNVQTTISKPTDSRRLIRVISARPNLPTIDDISSHNTSVSDIGKSLFII